MPAPTTQATRRAGESVAREIEMDALMCFSPKSRYYRALASILLLIELVTYGATQAEGDIRLTGGHQRDFGRLEIFWKEKWSTFCGISRGGAQAACRQLGFMDYQEYYPLYKLKDSSLKNTSQDPPIAVGNTFCNYKPTKGHLHVLGCGISVGIRYSCTHNKDIVVRCKNISLWENPYDTQVKLSGGDHPSSGVLEIYLLKQWGNVCGNVFDKGAANSACRQMGYTKSTSFSTWSNSSISNAWLSGASCNLSCSCFRSCFGEAPIRNFTCGQGNFVSLNCTYDVSMWNTPGSEGKCSKVSGELCGDNVPSLSFGTVMVIVILVLVLALVLVVISALFVFYTPVHTEKVDVFE